MKSAFASRHFSCFDNVSQEFCILLFGFCFFWFLSIGVWVKMPREWIRIALWLHGLWLTSVCTFFILTKKKSNILLTDPQLTWGGNLTDFNFLRSISTVCTHKKLNTLLLSANERAEIFATCRHFDLKSIIWSQSTASHLFARERSFHRPTSSSLLARWHLMITINSYLHTL